jgi:two-component system, NarL family, nitrate/nitrite response regulator NarL
MAVEREKRHAAAKLQKWGAPAASENFARGIHSRERGQDLAGVPTMNTAVRRSPISSSNTPRNAVFRIERREKMTAAVEEQQRDVRREEQPCARVYIAAENRLLREALSRMLMRRGDVDVVGLNCAGSFRVEGVIEEKPDILLLTSRGSLAEDVHVIRQVRLMVPAVRILLVGMSEDETTFLQYVRAGIKGYLPRDASSEDVLEAMRAVHAGEAICPGPLCASLFRFFEREASSLHSPAIQPRLGLTRREQQIVPLIAQGLTNKEIANQFCLSEQTVKNHLYRMKHKVGAVDRFGIVHLCRVHGFLV